MRCSLSPTYAARVASERQPLAFASDLNPECPMEFAIPIAIARLRESVQPWASASSIEGRIRANHARFWTSLVSGLAKNLVIPLCHQSREQPPHPVSFPVLPWGRHL